MPAAKNRPTVYKPNAAEVKKRKKAQDIVLARLSQGYTVKRAMEAVHRNESTYYGWRTKSPLFKRESDAIMTRRKDMHGGKSTDNEEYRTFVGFRKHYFGYETFAHQQRIVDVIERATPGSTSMILLPPEGGKTSVIEDYICQLLAENPNIRIAVISEGQGHAQKMLRRIKNRMEDNDAFGEYHAKYGPFREPERSASKAWNMNAITVLAKSGDERDFSLESRGSTSKIYGSRYDIIFIDDVQSIESLNQTAKLIEKYRQVWRTRVGKSGRVVITGTRVGRGDFYEEMMKLGLVRPENLVMIPARDDAGNSYFPAVFEKNGDRVLNGAGDPLGWSDEELKDREFEVGPEAWDRVYMQRSRTSNLATFQEPELRAAFLPVRGEDPDAPPKRMRGLEMIAGCDPALGGHAAFVVASYTSEYLFLEDVVDIAGLSRNEELFDVIEALSTKHFPSYWMIEVNNMQGGLARDERLLRMAREKHFYVLEHMTNRNKWDDQIGIKTMSGAFRRGQIRFPPDRERAVLFEPLVQQLLDWRGDLPSRQVRQDMVMSTWFVYLRWFNVRAQLKAETSNPFQREVSPGMMGVQLSDGTWR